MGESIGSDDEIIAFWFPFFKALSIDEYERFSWRWGLNLESTPELRSVAKHFALPASALLGYSVPEPVPELEIAAEVNTKEKLRRLWRTTFTQLEVLGQSATILDWYQYYDDLYKRLEPFVRVSGWDGLLLDWAKGSKLVKSQPPLAQAVRGQLQLIILRRWLEYYRSSDQIHDLERQARSTTLLDQWTQFVLLYGIGTWIINLGTFFAQIAYWKEIFGLLTPRQVIKLDTWGKSEFNYGAPGSLVKLSELLADVKLR
ncbi:MAG: hypothetical protein IPO91_16185 [Chloroflexi bacterium]|nr:hypothetical protein [Chloroflexota bacterium]